MRDSHSQRPEVGEEVLLVDGTEVAKEDALIGDLDYFGSGVVVFWSVARTNNRTAWLREASPTEQYSDIEEPEKKETGENRSTLSPVCPSPTP